MKMNLPSAPVATPAKTNKHLTCHTNSRCTGSGDGRARTRLLKITTAALLFPSVWFWLVVVIV